MARDQLTSSRAYYVRTDGSNANSGTSNTSSGAWQTPQYAYDFICANLDLGGIYSINVEMQESATFSGLSLDYPWTGGGSLNFHGNGGTVISTTDASCFNAVAPLPGVLRISNMKLQTSGSGNCLGFRGACSVEFGGIEFGSSGAWHIVANGPGVNINCLADLTISGSAFGFCLGVAPGRIQINNRALTLVGTPNFSAAFCYASRGCGIEITGNTYIGSATGSRYYVDSNAWIYSGATLPGNSAGTEVTGGRYL